MMEIPVSNARGIERDRFMKFLLDGIDSNSGTFGFFMFHGDNVGSGYSESVSKRRVPCSLEVMRGVIDLFIEKGYSVIRDRRCMLGEDFIIRGIID